MKFKLIIICFAALIALSGCKSTDSANNTNKAKSNSAQQEELCDQGTGTRLKKRC